MGAMLGCKFDNLDLIFGCILTPMPFSFLSNGGILVLGFSYYRGANFVHLQ